ncbi:MAG: S66 family peptidase [Spirochaetota bacterium]
MIKPKRLQRGARIAVTAPSSGLAARFPAVYRRGLSVLRKRFGFDLIEMPTARMTGKDLHGAPEKRARDINDAFGDESVDGILTTIGGDDSMRLLPLLDVELARAHPKLIIGGSDATTFLSYLSLHDLVTFYGPSVMAGFAQTDSLPREFAEHVEDFFFGDWDNYTYTPFPRFTHGYEDWSNPAAAGACLPFHENPGPRTIQAGNGVATGRLWGGCLEVLELLKGTPYWPSPDFFEGKILFLETSEEKPSPLWVGRYLRNYGLQGVLAGISALLIGRPKDYSDEERAELQRIVRIVVTEELGLEHLPIVTDLDFGHTDPKHLLPLGIKAEVDPAGPTVRLLESPFG